MRVLYPCHPLNPKEADELYQEEYQLLQQAHVKCSLFDFDAFLGGEFKPKPAIEANDLVLYRGWMLNLEHYQHLVSHIEKKKALPFTTWENYQKCHHLPGWYEACKAYTPETLFFPDDKHLTENIASLEWDAYFIKDFVKSNATARGSIAQSPAEAVEIGDGQVSDRKTWSTAAFSAMLIENN